MRELDPFLTSYELERLLKMNKSLKTEHDEYKKIADEEIRGLRRHIEEVDEKNRDSQSSIGSLVETIETMGRVMENLNNELINTKLVNIKQEMTTRTLVNMNQYNAHNMFVDTFTVSDDIDWGASIRGTWMEDLRSIGRTTMSTVYVEQSTVTSKLLITGNSGDDNAIKQSYTLDKDQDIDKISLFVERHSHDTWQPLHVVITDDMEGKNIVAEGTLNAAVVITEGWYEIEVENVRLEKFKEYFMTVYTDDTYGYRIGQHTTTDVYFVGTSYIQFSKVWTDNNYDIAFKIWCFASDDEGNATIVTIAHEFDGTLDSIVFEVEAVTFSGSINYFVSCDDGINWKILEPGIETDLTDIPSTNKVRIKTYIDGNSRVDAWGYVIKRSDK